jgi:hypothetical protein
MAAVTAAAAPEELYERDFYAWTQLQARALRRLAAGGTNLPLDLPHLTEEIRDLGKEQRNALRSWTTRIIEHLLLLRHAAAAEPRRGWIGEIVDFRGEIEDRLTPTLRRDLRRQLPRLYARACRNAARKLAAHGEPAAPPFPAACPYTLDQLLGDWWPESP